MSFCRNCGIKLGDDVKFCPKCGTQIAGKDATQLNDFEEQEKRTSIVKTQAANETKTEKESTNKSKNRIPVAVYTIAAIAVLGVSAFGIYTLLQNKGVVASNGDSVVSKLANKSKAEKKIVFSYKTGAEYGLMTSDLEIVDESLGSFIYDFSDKGVAVFHKEDSSGNLKAGLINTKGEVVKEPFANGIGGLGQNSFSSTSSLASKNGTFDFYIADYDSNKSTYGLIDSKGEIIYQLENKENCFIFPFFGRRITTIAIDGKTGVISETGEMLIEPVYSSITVVSDEVVSVLANESDTMADIINVNGEVIQEDASKGTMEFSHTNPEYITFSARNGKYGIMNLKLKVVLEPFASNNPSISEDGKYVVFQNSDESYALIDMSGKVILDDDYKSMTLPNSQGIISVQTKQGNFELIDIKSKKVFLSVGDVASLYPISGTNLFEKIDLKALESIVLGPKGSELKEDYKLGINNRPVCDGYLEYVNLESKGSGDYFYSVLDKNGKLLSNNAVYTNDLGNGQLFIQEKDGNVKVVEKDTGKIIKEKNLETKQSTAASSKE